MGGKFIVAHIKFHYENQFGLQRIIVAHTKVLRP